MAVKCQAVRVLFHSHSAIRRLSVDPFTKLWLCFLHLGRRRLRSRHTQTYPTLASARPSQVQAHPTPWPRPLELLSSSTPSTPELDSLDT